MQKFYAAAFWTILVFGAARISAQERALQLSLVRYSNNSIDFKYEKTDPGTLTVIMEFNELTNTSSYAFSDFSAKGYAGTLLSLAPRVKEQAIGIGRYSYTYIRGKLNPKFDLDFVYVLPAKPGTKIKVAEAGFVGSMYFGNTSPADWKFYRFFTDQEDEVRAIRKGVVVEVKDLYEADKSGQVVYSDKRNEIRVEHADGTLALYQGFKKSSIAVKVGEVVYPGSLLGTNTFDSYNRYYVAVAITYLKSAELKAYREQTLKNQKSLYGFITPKFSVANESAIILSDKGDYLVSLPADVVQKEMSKREIKERSPK